jgi:phage terminase large subunit GpA-like protein
VMRTACDVIGEVARKALAERERIGVAEWADRYRQVVVSARRGQWQTSLTPYLRGPMEAYTDPMVREITVMSARQVGKTELVYNCLFYTIDADPADSLFIYPTKELAAFNNRRRFLPTLKRTPRVRRWLGQSPRDAGASELNFSRMVLRFIGSNSESNMESYPYRNVLIDEHDRCAPDTLAQARETVKTFAESKIMKVSTPSEVGVGIDGEYNGTQVAVDDEDGGGTYQGTPPADRRRYVVPCPTCGEFHVRVFSLVRWEGGKTASKAAVKNGAYMVCPRCESKILAADNLWQLQHGLWAPVPRGASGAGGATTNVILPRKLEWDGQGSGVGGPGAVELRGGTFDLSPAEMRYGEHVGFALTGLCSSLEANPYGAVAAKWIGNGGVMVRSFVNRTLGEAWAVKGEAADVKAIAARAGGYGIGEVPAGVLAITMGVDVQQDRMFVEVLGWGERGEVCWMIECHEIARARGANLAELDALAKKVWVRQDGRKIGVRVLAVDSGKFTDEVYRWVMKWKPGLAVGEGPTKVWAVKGEEGKRSPLPWRESSVTARADRAASAIGEGLPLLIVNTTYWKEHMLARLSGHAEGEMHVDDWRFPTGVPKAYLMQITAEQLVRERRGGQMVTAWVLRPGRTANHYGDCRVYGCAAADREGVRRLRAPAGAAGQAAAQGARRPVVSAPVAEGRTSLMARAAERSGRR